MRRFDVVAICFVAFLLLSNIGATKLIGFDVAGLHLVFDGGAILFPLTYILGDVLSEVYGFAATRRVVITGFVVQFIASVTFWLIQIAPADDAYTNQAAFEAVLGQVPRFVAASLLGFLAGQLLNSFVLVRIKERYGQGRLWARLLGSSVVGESVDSVIFCTVAWAGNVSMGVLLVYMVTGFVYKVAVEAALLPFTYAAVAWVRRTDGSLADDGGSAAGGGGAAAGGAAAGEGAAANGASASEGGSNAGLADNADLAGSASAANNTGAAKDTSTAGGEQSR